MSTLPGIDTSTEQPVPDESRTPRAARLALSIVVVAMPAVMTCALLGALFDATLLDYFPKVSDELAYYQQIATFVAAGFDGGYFTNDEAPARVAASRFGVHGPAFPVMYGIAGRLVGWSIPSGPIFNLAVLGLALTVFIVTTRPSLVRTLVLGLVVLTSWWVTLMASITMQESLNQAFMVIAAAFAVRLLDPDARSRARLVALMLTMLVIASVLRPTNWIAAIPLVLIAVPRRPLFAAAGALAACVGIPVFWLLWRFISAPIPGLPLEVGGASLADAISRIASYFLDQIATNIEHVFDMQLFLERPFFQYAVYESVAIAAFSAALALWAVRRARADSTRGGSAVDVWARPEIRVDVLNAILLGLALIALFGFYFDSEASISRVIAPFLLFSQLVLAATGCRRWLLAAMIAASVLVAPSFLTTYRDWRGDLFVSDRARFETFRNQISGLIVFREGASGWCNTLLTMTYDREIVGVPPGIGLSVARDTPAPIKSRYLLLTDGGPERYHSRAHLEHLGTTVLGELFLNRDAVCE